MEATLIDVGQAAELLGVHPTRVHQLVRQGMLRPRYLRKRGLNVPMTFHLEEVSALAEVREKNETDVQKIAAMAAQAFATARQLERRVELLESVLGRVAWPLHTDEESVVALYARAQDAHHAPDTSLGGVLEWARIFIAMGEEYLDVTEALTGDENCWKVFLDLADLMFLAATPRNLELDRELAAAFAYLDVGRRNLRALSFFYVRNRFGTHAANAQFESSDIHHEVIQLATEPWR